MFLSIKSHLRVRIALAGVMAMIFAITPVFNIRQADAAIPQTINYQSRLMTPGGLAVTSTTAIQLSFYLHPTNGAPGDAPAEAGPLVWKEVYDQGSGACSMVTPDSKGYFFLKLGSCNPFPAYLDFSDIMYVGVKIGADAEASPRVQLSSHPYALNAYRLNGYEATSTATANQLLALDSNLNFNIATGTFTGAGLFINGTSTLQQVTFTVATGTSLNLTQYLAIGAIRLDSTGSNNQTSGAYLVGVFDEFTNSNATTVQAALFDLDTAITTVSSTLYAMDLQQVTDNGATTTNRIQFAGATSTGDFLFDTAADASVAVQRAPNSTDGHNLYLSGGNAGLFSMAGNSGGDVIINGGLGSGFPAIPGNVILADVRGDVGIGVSVPNSKLHIDSQSASTTAIVTFGNNAGDYQTFNIQDDPEGQVIASVGDMALDSSNGAMYVKVTGNSTATGWQRVFTSDTGLVTLDSAYDGGGSGAGRFIITDAGPIQITNTTGTLGFMSVTHSTNGEGLWVNNLGDGSAFSARNMGAGAGYYSRNQGTGYGARLDNSTDNGIGLFIDNPVNGTGFSLANAGAGLGQRIVNSGDGIGLRIENNLSMGGLGMHVIQNMGRGMVLDNNTLNDGLTINNNDTGRGIYIYNLSDVAPGFYLDDLGGKTGFYIDKTLNGGNAMELNTDDGARAFYVAHTGTGEAFWMRNQGTGSSIWIEDAAVDTTPFVLNSSGYLGIGTSTPAYYLDVNGDARVASQFMLGRYASLPASGYQAGSLVYKTSSSTINYWDGTTWRTVATAEDVRSSLWDEDHDTGVQVEESADEDYVRFDTAGVERMYIRNDGHVGIGTDNPLSSLLTVGPGSHEASTFSAAGIPGMVNIANFRDENGENVFRAGGSVAGNDLVVGFGDLDYGGIGTSMQVNYGANAIELSHSEFRFSDVSGNKYVGLISPAVVATNTIWTLPGADGINNQVLITNGAGTLSWATSSDLVYNIYNSDGLIPENRNVTIADGYELRFVDQSNPANFLYFQPDYNTNGNLRIGAVNNDEGNTNHYLEFMDNFKMVSQHGIEIDASTSQVDLYGNNAVLHIGADNQFYDFRAAGSRYGLRYTDDYSADFVARSLVDKGYVDNKVASSTNNIYGADGYLASDRIVNGIGRGLNVSTTNGGFFDADIRDGSDLGFIHVRSDEVEMNVANPLSYSGLVFNSGGVSFTHNGSGSTTQFYIGSNMTLTDGMNLRGIEYAADYSANYTNRTLVDKEYVDNAITSSTVSAGNGLTLDSGVMKLGGALTEMTYIDHMGYDLVVREFAGETETLFAGDNFKIQNGTHEIRFGIGGPTAVGLTLENPSSTFSMFTFADYVSVTSSRSDFLGLVYDKDYSNYFVDRSLVDKGYVDDAITSSTLLFANGLVNASGTVELGGSMTKNTDIALDTYRLQFNATDGYHRIADDRTEFAYGYSYFTAEDVGFEVEAADENEIVNYYMRNNLFEISGYTSSSAINPNFHGATYGNDYSAYFVDRSLVDKGYVDNHLSAAAGSGLTWDAINNEIDLGGSLTGNTSINYGNWDFRIQNGNSYQMYNNTNYVTYVSDGIDTTSLLQNKDNILISGSAGFVGATYEFDYSANFTPRSLVDKAYVDNAIVSATTTLQAAYDAGGSALGRQIYTLNNANPVEILNPGIDQWETGLALTNASNGSGLAMQTMHSFGDRGAKLYFADDTSDPANATGAYMDWNELTSSFEFGYQTVGTRNSSFYIDANQMSLNIPGTTNNGAFRIQATNYNIPVLTLATPAFPSSISMQMSVGTSTPESRVTANSGSVFYRTDGIGSSQQLYVKTTDGSNTGWYALAGADSNHWQKNTNVLSPTDSGVYQIAVTNNNASTLTGFKAVNTNDVSNYAGAVVEMKGSGADYTNNMYFGKYGAAFWIPSWAGNGVLATDKNLVLGAVGASSIIRYQIGGGYSAPITVATMDSNSMDFQSGVNVNVASNVIVQGLTSSTGGLFINATGTNLYAANQVMLGQHALNPASGLQAGALIYNTASSTPFVWNGSTWVALSGSGSFAGSLWDADHDTGIQVEESTDEDVIRFDTAGTEYFTMQGPRLSVLNSGSSVFLGLNAGRVDNLSNRQNVYIGTSAGYNNVTGLYNVSIGYEALYNHANPNNTTAIGHNAGRNYSGAFGGTMVGYRAGFQSSGNDNVMVGYESGMENTGSDNFFMGRGTGWYNTGNNNIMMGYYTGYDNKGSSSILFGVSAGSENKGNRAIFLGESAGRVNVGDDNIFMGYESGRSNATGTRNLFLGRQAGYSNVLGNGNIFLGYQAGYGETNSDRLYIDNSNTSAPLVYGEFDTNVFRINGALQINNPSSTGYALPTTDGNSGQVLITNGSGNAVWVSSSVLGADTFQDVTDRGAITTNWIQFAGATSTGHIIPGTHDTYSLGNTDYRWSDIWGSNLHIGTSTWDLAQADNGAFTISQRDNSEMMRITPDGNIGLGTEVPEELLSLNSDMLIGQWDGGILPSGGYSRQMIIRATDGALPGIQGTAYTTYQRNGVNIVQMGLDTSDNMAFSHYSGSWVRDMVISTAGNVGIGNTVPSRRLDVLGSTTPGDNLFRAAGGANGAYLSMYASTTDDRNMVIEVQRNLQFYSQANAVMSLNNDGTVGFGTDSIDARINVAQSAGIAAAFNRTNDDGTIVSLRQDGVEEGTISVSANTISYNAFTGSHYAWTDETIEKGLLVALTGENRYLNNNPQSEIIYGITKSSTVNDSKVMGAYLSLQEPSKSHGDKNPHLIMAVGNGEVWVADKGENINIGDYLISSDVMGHAQKDTSEFMISHIVARAAESIDWTHVSVDVDGVKHKKISVFFESFDKNNMQGSLAGTSLQGGENNVEAVDLVVANAVFEGNVTVKGHLAMGRDTVGQAMLLVGATRVSIDFTEDYGTLPIITLTPAGKVTVPYWVENASMQGFDIVLDEVQYTDLIFNWHAFGSHEGKVYVSNGTTLDIVTNDMGVSELETQVSANGTTPVPAPVEEVEEVSPIADQPVLEEPEAVDEPAVIEEVVEQNEYSEEQEVAVQEESQPVESNELTAPETELEPAPQMETVEEQTIE